MTPASVLEGFPSSQHPVWPGLEFRPRTAWALLNAFTGTMKERGGSQPQSYATQTMRLHALLDPERN
jgi:hypothetical protein